MELAQNPTEVCSRLSNTSVEQAGNYPQRSEVLDSYSCHTMQTCTVHIHKRQQPGYDNYDSTIDNSDQ